MTKQEFTALIKEGTLLLDGATGSNLMMAGMPRGVCTEQWIIEHEAVIVELQRAYAEAGSKIIYAPTFAANAVSLAEHGLAGQVKELNLKLTALSKKAVGDCCYVAGDITTMGKADASYDTLYSTYREQILYLQEAGVDLLVAETMIGMDETIAAIDAFHSVSELPIMCSMTIESDGSLFFGGNVYEAAAAFEEMGVSAVGINCSTGPDKLEAVVANLRKTVKIPLLVKPNAGMPVIDENGNAIYDMKPQDFARHMKRLVALGADLVGGCCGTTPEYIRELSAVL